MEDTMVSNPFDDSIHTDNSRLNVIRAVNLHLEFVLGLVKQQMDMAEEEYKDSGEDEDFGAFRALKELEQYIIDSKEEFVNKVVKHELGHTGTDFANGRYTAALPPITARRGGIEYTNTNYIPQSYSPQAIITHNDWNTIGNI